MCVTIIYDGRVLETMEKARKCLGDANIVIRGGYTIDAMEGAGCLCPIDLEETAKRLKRTLRQPSEENGDPMEVAFE